MKTDTKRVVQLSAIIACCGIFWWWWVKLPGLGATPIRIIGTPGLLLEVRPARRDGAKVESWDGKRWVPHVILGEAG